MMKRIILTILSFFPLLAFGQIANNFFWSHGVNNGLPVVYLYDITGITSTSATGWGYVSSDGGATITERGVCWNTGGNPTTSDSKQTAAGTTGSYSCSITPLSASTLYYVRAYAINSVGTSYSSPQSSFTTAAAVGYPSVSSNASVTDITETTATFGGNVTADGGASVTDRGSCWSTSANPTIADSHTHDGTGTGVFSSSLTGLSMCENYYIRAYATNSTGTAYGDQRTFQAGADDDATNKFNFSYFVSTFGGASYNFTSSCGLAYNAYIDWTTDGKTLAGYVGYTIHSTLTVGDYFYKWSGGSAGCATLLDGWYLVSIGASVYKRVHLVSGIIVSVDPAENYCTALE